MEIQKQVAEDLKAALKQGNAEVKDVLRMLSADFKNKAIELRGEISEADALSVLRRNIKLRKDSIEQFIAGGRVELAEKEKTELAVLEKYLPAQMNAEEIEKSVREVLGELDEAARRNFGLVMKAVMQKVGDAADGKTVSEAVKKILSS